MRSSALEAHSVSASRAVAASACVLSSMLRKAAAARDLAKQHFLQLAAQLCPSLLFAKPFLGLRLGLRNLNASKGTGLIDCDGKLCGLLDFLMAFRCEGLALVPIDAKAVTHSSFAFVPACLLERSLLGVEVQYLKAQYQWVHPRLHVESVQARAPRNPLHLTSVLR